MKTKKLRLILLLAVVLTTMIAFVGCGNEGGKKTPGKDAVLTFIPLLQTDFSNDVVGKGPQKNTEELYSWTMTSAKEQNKSYVKVVTDESGNNYLRLFTENEGKSYDARASKTISLSRIDELQVQFKVKTVKNGASITFLDANNVTTTVWECDGYDDWTEVKLLLNITDIENPTRTTYVNGELVSEGEAIKLPADISLVAMGFRGKDNTIVPGGNVYFDDISVGYEMWVSDDLILEPNQGINWKAVIPTNKLGKKSFVNNMTSHPRILVSEWEEILEKIDTENRCATWYQTIKKEADDAVSRGAPEYTLEAEMDSDIELFRTCRARLEALAFAYNVEKLKGNEEADKYLNAAYEQMVAIGEYPEWDGELHYLSTAEVTMGYACAYDWLYDALTEEQRSIIFEIVKEHSLKYLVNHYEGRIIGIGFTHTSSNWNPMCNGAAMASAFAFADEQPEICEYVMERAPEFIEYAAEIYAPEGSYTEGVSYWNYGTTNIALVIDMLENGFAEGFKLPEKWNYDEYPGINITCDYPIYFTGTTQRFNYGDCNVGMEVGSLFYWYAKQYNNSHYAWYNNYILDEYKYKLSKYDAIEALCWYDAEKTEPVDYPLDKVYVADAENGAFNGVAMRSSWDRDALYTAMQGGHNGTYHMHLSLGTYIIDYHGKRFVRVITDKDYSIGGAKYDTYYKRAEAYNCLVINPNKYQDQALKGYANVIADGSSDNTAFAIMDMSKAYDPGDNAKIVSAKRGLMLTDSRNRVVVQDEVTLDAESEFYWFANTDADIEIGYDKKSAILNIDGERMLVRIIEGPENAGFEIMEAKSLTEGVNNAIRLDQKLAIHITGMKEINLAVEYIGLSEGEGIPAVNEYVPLDKWTADDNDTFKNLRQGGKRYDNNIFENSRQRW